MVGYDRALTPTNRRAGRSSSKPMIWEIEVRNEGHAFYLETHKSPKEAQERADLLKKELQKIMDKADISVTITGSEMESD